MAIPENLKEFRKKRNMSQMELSRQSGVSQAEISYIESGHKMNPGIVTIKKLADALKVSVDNIIE